MSDSVITAAKEFEARNPVPQPFLATPARAYRLPAPTAAEIARGLAAAYDSAGMHCFNSWTDGDLYRAIAGEPGGPGHDAAVAEYVKELNARRAFARQQADLEAQINDQFGINGEKKLP